MVGSILEGIVNQFLLTDKNRKKRRRLPWAGVFLINTPTMAAKNWIQGANIKKGAFTAQAQKAGMSVHAYAEKEKDAPGTTGKRARLALTFEKMRRKR